MLFTPCRRRRRSSDVRATTCRSALSACPTSARVPSSTSCRAAVRSPLPCPYTRHVESSRLTRWSALDPSIRRRQTLARSPTFPSAQLLRRLDALPRFLLTCADLPPAARRSSPRRRASRSPMVRLPSSPFDVQRPKTDRLVTPFPAAQQSASTGSSTSTSPSRSFPPS